MRRSLLLAFLAQGAFGIRLKPEKFPRPAQDQDAGIFPPALSWDMPLHALHLQQMNATDVEMNDLDEFVRPDTRLIGNSSALIRWTKINSLEVSNYEVRVSVDGHKAENWAHTKNMWARDPREMEATIAGLDFESLYGVKIAALLKNGTVLESPMSKLNTKVGRPSAPSKPHLVNGSLSYYHLGLEWRPPLRDGGIPIGVYRIYSKKIADSNGYVPQHNHSWQYSHRAQISGPFLQFMLLNLTDNTTYQFKICATHGMGAPDGDFGEPSDYLTTLARPIAPAANQTCNGTNCSILGPSLKPSPGASPLPHHSFNSLLSLNHGSAPLPSHPGQIGLSGSLLARRQPASGQVPLPPAATGSDAVQAALQTAHQSSFHNS